MTTWQILPHNNKMRQISGIVWFGLFFVLAVLPAMLMFAKSFIAEGNLSLAHYREVFSEARVFSFLMRSLLMAVGATILSVFIGVTLALLISRFNFRGKGLCRVMYLIPLFIPPHIHAIVWIFLCGENGVVNRFMMHLFDINYSVLPINSVLGSIIILSLSYFPIVVLLTMTGLCGLDRRVEEVAVINKPPLFVMSKITLPLLHPYIVAGAIYVFIFSFFNYGVPAMLRIQSYPGEIFSRFSAFYDEAGAAALSSPVVLLAIFLLFVQNWFMKNKKVVSLNGGFKEQSVSCPTNKYVAILVYGWLFLSVALPVGVLILQAGSFASYVIALQGSVDQLKTTLLVATLSATCMSVLALFLVSHIESLPARQQQPYEILTFMPFAFPAIFLGIGLIYLWNTPFTQFIYSTMAILVIACIARFIPFAIQIVRAQSQQVDNSLREAAYLCSSGRLRRWFYIEMPLMSKGVITCWLITFFFCTGELGATLLVVTPRHETVSLKIYNLLHYGAGHLVAALALILIFLNVVVSCSLLFFRSMWKKV